MYSFSPSLRLQSSPQLLYGGGIRSGNGSNPVRMHTMAKYITPRPTVLYQMAGSPKYPTNSSIQCISVGFLVTSENSNDDHGAEYLQVISAFFLQNPTYRPCSRCKLYIELAANKVQERIPYYPGQRPLLSVNMED